MDIVTQSTKILENTLFVGSVNSTTNISYDGNTRAQSILLIQSTTASIGIVANLTVIVVFLNHKKLRRKIPNIFIINQVRHKNEILYISLSKFQFKIGTIQFDGDPCEKTSYKQFDTNVITFKQFDRKIFFHT